MKDREDYFIGTDDDIIIIKPTKEEQKDLEKQHNENNKSSRDK